jgi:diadenosine tetraphosphate (Ap4A) HIT family hydrolase
VVVPIEVDHGCTLCRLISGQLERSVVYEDDQVVAFMDHQPVNPGHVLVVPQHHALHLDQLDENLSLEVYRIAHRMTRALRRSGLRCEGVNLFLADGEAAFQEVPHVHMHVFSSLPRRLIPHRCGLAASGPYRARHCCCAAAGRSTGR